MSVEILLIPIGLAAWAAIRELRSTDLCEKCKSTRITDQTVLVDALEALGATITSSADDRITATSEHGDLTFQKVGQAYLGRVDKAFPAATDKMLAELDTKVGRLMQQRTAAMVVERAQTLGYRVVSQHDDNGNMNYVFEEAR
jgi:hypothetical protein